MLVWSLFLLYMILSKYWCPYDSLLMSPYDLLSEQFFIFFRFNFYLIYSILIEEALLSCEKNWDFQICMILMMWNIRTSRWKKSDVFVCMCLCVRVCAFVHVFKIPILCCFKDKNGKIAIFLEYLFSDWFSAKTYW